MDSPVSALKAAQSFILTCVQAIGEPADAQTLALCQKRVLRLRPPLRRGCACPRASCRSSLFAGPRANRPVLGDHRLHSRLAYIPAPAHPRAGAFLAEPDETMGQMADAASSRRRLGERFEKLCASLVG